MTQPTPGHRATQFTKVTTLTVPELHQTHFLPLLFLIFCVVERLILAFVVSPFINEKEN